LSWAAKARPPVSAGRTRLDRPLVPVHPARGRVGQAGSRAVSRDQMPPAVPSTVHINLWWGCDRHPARRSAPTAPSPRGTGVRGSVVLRVPSRLRILHIGDSRAYLLRDPVLRPLTTDHSAVAELVALGRLTREQARRAPGSNLITRCVGCFEPGDAADIFDVDVLPGDLLLLTTDGLTHMVPEADIEATCNAVEDVAVLPESLERATLAAGGHDNITIVVARRGGTDLHDDHEIQARLQRPRATAAPARHRRLRRHRAHLPGRAGRGGAVAVRARQIAVAVVETGLVYRTSARLLPCGPGDAGTRKPPGLLSHPTPILPLDSGKPQTRTRDASACGPRATESGTRSVAPWVLPIPGRATYPARCLFRNSSCLQRPSRRSWVQRCDVHRCCDASRSRPNED
jgi:hypothetical protein